MQPNEHHIFIWKYILFFLSKLNVHLVWYDAIKGSVVKHQLFQKVKFNA
jgi:hypothetical protein